MAAPMSPPRRSLMHGVHQEMGVWSHEGKAELEHKRQSIGKDLVLKHEGASNSVNDFLYANTMFSNGGGEPIGHTSTTRHCHLGHDLVPYNSFSPHSELRPVDGPRPAMPGQHSPPGRRLSAIEFDDGLSHSRVLSQRPPPSSQHTPERGGRASLDQRLGTHHNAPAASPGGRSRGPPTLYTAAGPHHFPSDMIPTEGHTIGKVVHHGGIRVVKRPQETEGAAASPLAASSPSRVPTDGGWRLTSSMSESQLDCGYKRWDGASRKVVPQSDHRFQSDNARLWDARAQQQQQTRQHDRQFEDTALSSFSSRWGFPNSGVYQEIPIRRRANMEKASSVTLTGPGCSFQR